MVRRAIWASMVMGASKDYRWTAGIRAGEAGSAVEALCPGER
jgi:hypothetical protein